MLKKKTMKLSLNTERVRMLTNTELLLLRGGVDGVPLFCTNTDGKTCNDPR